MTKISQIQNFIATPKHWSLFPYSQTTSHIQFQTTETYEHISVAHLQKISRLIFRTPRLVMRLTDRPKARISRLISRNSPDSWSDLSGLFEDKLMNYGQISQTNSRLMIRPSNPRSSPGRGMSGKKMQEMSGIWAESFSKFRSKPLHFFDRNERNLSGKKCKKWAEFERNKKCKKWAEFERNQKCKIWAEFERNQKCKKWSEFERKKMQEMIGETFRPHFCLIRGRFESWNRLNTVGKNLQLN